MKPKNPLSFGQHLLFIETVAPKNNKVTLVFQPVAKGFDSVLRTFVIGNAAYEAALISLGVKQMIIDPLELKKLVVGKMVSASIGPGKNGYVNLVSINKHWDSYPKKVVAIYLKAINQSNDRGNTNVKDEA
jgi:hypothetical protein